MNTKLIFLAFAACFTVAPSFATQTYCGDIGITKLSVFPDGRFGRCVMDLDTNINTCNNNGIVLDCNQPTRLSFDCTQSTGFLSKSSSVDAWNSAQLAFVTGATVNLTARDEYKLPNLNNSNDVCLATSIEVNPPQTP